MKSILLHADNDGGLSGRLGAALDVVRAFAGHLSCVQTTPYDAFILSDPFGGVYTMPAILDSVRGEEEAHRARMEEKLAAAGLPWDWRRGDGETAQVLVDHARLADLVVVSLHGPEDGGRQRALAVAADVAIHARGPVLAVPQGVDRIDCGGAALVAWNGSAEASHALRAALPMLAAASAVHVVTVSDDQTDFPATDACHYLARHGVAAELHQWPRGEGSVADALLDAAAGLKAAYIVAGAYGHSRVREAVIGGATRGLLDASRLPLVLAH